VEERAEGRWSDVIAGIAIGLFAYSLPSLFISLWTGEGRSDVVRHLAATMISAFLIYQIRFRR
jgi:ABC-type uncharacterized transport system permease subunit